jgi:hypothetical protein
MKTYRVNNVRIEKEIDFKWLFSEIPKKIPMSLTIFFVWQIIIIYYVAWFLFDSQMKIFWMKEQI